MSDQGYESLRLDMYACLGACLVCLAGDGLAADRPTLGTGAGSGTVLLVHAARAGRAHAAVHAVGALWPALLLVARAGRLGALAGAHGPAARGRGRAVAVWAHRSTTGRCHGPRWGLRPRMAWSALGRHRALAWRIVGAGATGARVALRVDRRTRARATLRWSRLYGAS